MLLKYVNHTIIDVTDEVERSKSVVSGREGTQEVSRSTAYEMHATPCFNSYHVITCHFILVESCRLVTYLWKLFLTHYLVIIMRDEIKRDVVRNE